MRRAAATAFSSFRSGSTASARGGRALLGTAAALVVVLLAACDSPRSAAPVEAAAPAPTPTIAPPPEPPHAPDIVVDASSVTIGKEHVAVGELGLSDKIAVFLKGTPGVEATTVNVVAMRNAKPSPVAAVVSALKKAKASGAVVKCDARDGTTQTMPVSFTASVGDCTTAAWIAKDASIDVWPAGGGTAHRVIKGLAGPDMTLGTEALRRQWSSCGSPELVIGGDDAMTFGLVFDLARNALEAAGTRISTTVLVTNVSPGRKVTLE
ncbi:MAG TPA: hypothetical protein VGG39_07200 [Polyangiaceae bacterium]|jgi:hypothetical protein